MSIEINASKGIKQNTTEVTKIPVGTTAQRPDSPQAGMIRFNTDNGEIEAYDPALDGWRAINQAFAEAVIATGGTVTDITQNGQIFRVHTFTSSGTFEVTRGGEVEYLVIAGGGGGGAGLEDAATGGGGGAGGYRSSVQGERSGRDSASEQKLEVTPQVYSITVGAGGGGAGASGNGDKGGNSSFGSIVSEGGGFGAAPGGTSGSGGSGGGRPWQGARGLGVANQGFDGSNFNSGGSGAGGGGAGSQSTTRDGGDGISSTIDGSSVTRATGGSSNVNGTGAVNTGNGGFSQTSPRTGTSGGSGIVIVRYRIG